MKLNKRQIRADVLKELSFLESLSLRCPQDVEILQALGNLYTKTGRYKDGLKVDLALSRLCSREPIVWYNLACSYALMARTDEALSALSRAVDMGYKDYRWIREDADLKSIRKDQRFEKLLQRLMTGKDAPHHSA